MLLYMRKCILAALALFLVPTVSFAEVSKEFVMCRNGKTVRTVRVIDRNGECVTIYTKSGIDKDVGGGKNPISCTKIVENIRSNLEKAGWKCRAVGEATATISQ